MLYLQAQTLSYSAWYQLVVFLSYFLFFWVDFIPGFGLVSKTFLVILQEMLVGLEINSKTPHPTLSLLLHRLHMLKVSHNEVSLPSLGLSTCTIHWGRSTVVVCRSFLLLWGLIRYSYHLVPVSKHRVPKDVRYV